MRRLYSLCAVAGSAVILLLAAAVAASAATPLQEYQRSGQITPCKYTSGQLGGKVPNDVEQYAPDYKSQLEAAARQRARGCGGSNGGGAASSGGGAIPGGGAAATGGGGAGPGGTGASGSGSPAAVPPAPPIDPTTGEPATGIGQPAITASDKAGISTSLLLLLIVGGLVVLGALLALVARYLGWSPRWLAPAMHSVREARMRIGTTAGGFADWARPAPRST